MDTLRDVFTDMKYVRTESNVTGDRLKRVINEFQKVNHGDSAFIIFYGHGTTDHIVTSDNHAIHVEDLQN